MGLTERMTASLTLAARGNLPSGSHGRDAPSVYSTAVTGAAHCSASSRSLGLSHKNSPVSSR